MVKSQHPSIVKARYLTKLSSYESKIENSNLPEGNVNTLYTKKDLRRCLEEARSFIEYAFSKDPAIFSEYMCNNEVRRAEEEIGKALYYDVYFKSDEAHPVIRAVLREHPTWWYETDYNTTVNDWCAIVTPASIMCLNKALAKRSVTKDNFKEVTKSYCGDSNFSKAFIEKFDEYINIMK